MLDHCSQALHPSRPAGLKLTTMWTVETGPGYDARPRGYQNANEWVLLRTHAGCGAVELVDRPSQLLPANSLLLVPRPRIRRYRVTENHWAFWWFELSAPVEAPFPSGRAVQVDPCDEEAALVQRCRHHLERGDAANARVASALATVLVSSWSQSWEADQEPGGQLVGRATARMVDSLGSHLRMADLARGLGVSERHLRQRFISTHGIGPKAWYDALRLERGRELLRQGLLSVSDVAERLGYSSPFHFSRAFSERFEHPPSHLRRPSELH